MLEPARSTPTRFLQAGRSGQGATGPMRREIGWRLTCVLILLVPLTGCDTNRQAAQSLSDSGGLMDLWSTYTHCHRSTDLDAIREDARQLNHVAQTFDSAGEDSRSAEHGETFLSGSASRLSVDPAAMAASCTLHAGQAAQELGRMTVAREMFQMVVLRFPQPRYQYYTDQALLGLEHLDTTSRPTL